MLAIKNLYKKFGSKNVIDNVSLEVAKGSVAIFLGSSGVGKSTLLRLLNNLDTPDAGTVTLDGTTLDITTVNKTHAVGMVFQHFNLFEHLTVEQNITLALINVLNSPRKKAEDIAHALLERYGLADKANTSVSSLSGGQKQRLAIARTIALKPKIVCMDEPTSALDPLLTTHVANNIQELAREGYIVLVASHDTALLEKLDCMIYLMENGRIIESAPSHEFQQNKTSYPRINTFVAGHIDSK